MRTVWQISAASCPPTERGGVSATRLSGAAPPPTNPTRHHQPQPTRGRWLHAAVCVAVCLVVCVAVCVVVQWYCPMTDWIPGSRRATALVETQVDAPAGLAGWWGVAILTLVAGNVSCDLEPVEPILRQLLPDLGVRRPSGGRCDALKVQNGRKNVKSAPYRPILSANRRRQRPTAVYAHADPAQTGGNGGN